MFMIATDGSMEANVRKTLISFSYSCNIFSVDYLSRKRRVPRRESEVKE
jgi:hypothetical protein